MPLRIDLSAPKAGHPARRYAPNEQESPMPSLTNGKYRRRTSPARATTSFDLDRVLASVVGLHSLHPRRRLQRGNARHRARRQRRPDRRRTGPDHRLSDHRGRSGLAASRRRPRGEGHALGFDSEPASAWCRRSAASISIRCRSARPRRRSSATAWWSAAPADAPARSPARSPPSRNSPAIGNICWMRRSSPIPRIRTGAAPALISNRGELIGIGSLQLERERDGKAEHVNMIVPIDSAQAGARRSAQVRPRQQAGTALARHVFDRDRQPASW